MDPDRLRRIAVELRGATSAQALERVLVIAVEMLRLTGASVAVAMDGVNHGTLAATSPGSARLSEIEFDLGEGPCTSASVAAGPILEPDLTLAAPTWPAFVPPALAAGTRAMFAFPLRVGAAHLGVLSLDHGAVGDLSDGQIADATTFVRITTHLLLELQRDVPAGNLPDNLADVVDERAHVHQATGMVAAQLGVDVATALGHLRAHAWTAGRTVAEVSVDVLARRLRFEP